MGTFSYTKQKKLSMGNRIAYLYKLTDVQTSGSKLYTPFKKITGYIIETTSDTTPIAVAANHEAGATTGVQEGDTAYLEFVSDNADADGFIIVVGLL